MRDLSELLGSSGTDGVFPLERVAVTVVTVPDIKLRIELRGSV